MRARLIWACSEFEADPELYPTIESEYPVLEREIALFEGWNLIGLPLTPVDPSIEVVLADILDKVIVVWAFDGETDTWSFYLPAVPELGTLTEMVARAIVGDSGLLSWSMGQSRR